MNRREAIQRVAMLMGGTVIGASLFLEGCQRSASKDIEMLFDSKSIDFLGDLAEAILPKTTTPGAKEAGVGSEIPVLVRDCYKPEEQRSFWLEQPELTNVPRKNLDAIFSNSKRKTKRPLSIFWTRKRRIMTKRNPLTIYLIFSHCLNSLLSLHFLAQNWEPRKYSVM